MFPLALLVLLFYYDVAQAFVGAPTLLSTARANAIYTKGWGSSIARHTIAASLAAPPRGPSAAGAPSMSLMLLAEAEDAATAAADLPVSVEAQESIISALSLASSVLLLVIIGGAVYLSLAEWKNKKELEETAKYTSAGQLPPDVDPVASSPSDSDEEGNRLQRRMMKKEKRKSGKI
eukprot:g11756.t1